MGRLQHAAPWLLAAAVFGLGVVWRDCVLIAGSAVLVLQAFHRHMDARAPWPGWAAAARCCLMGAAAFMAALALAGTIAAAWFELWIPANDHGIWTWVLFALVQCTLWALYGESPWETEAGRIGLWTLAAASVASLEQQAGAGIAPCLFSLLVSAGLVVAGWRLAREDAPAFLCGGQRR